MSKHAFNKIKAGIEEAIAIARGEADPATYRVHSNARDRGSRSSLRDLADRIPALTPKVPQTDSTDLVREDRTR
jgi:hypothetical protein